MRVDVLELEYVSSEHECVQSYSAQDPGYARTLYRNGASSVNDRGTGWMDVFYPSRLILFVKVDGEEKEIWLERSFRKALGRLTPKRRRVIQDTMPKEVEVMERCGRKGTKYFVLTDQELQAWILRIQAVLA